MNRSHLRGFWIAVVVVLVWTGVASAEIKNVILMISDGAGYNHWNSASMYQGKWDAVHKKSTEVYDGPGWVKFGCSTHPLNRSSQATGDDVQDPNLVYDPVRAWDQEKGYAWLMSTYTDSAAASTALSTGRKTYNGAINWSNTGEAIRPTLCELAKEAGKSVGIVTTVQWSHATPGGLSNARNTKRGNYAEIASDMLKGHVLDVIMGAGNPDFDNNGAPIVIDAGDSNRSNNGAPVPKKTKKKTKQYKYVGGPEIWNAIEAARAQPDGTYEGFRPVSTKAEFEALTSGPTPAKVVGTAQVGTTLQQARRKTNPEDPAKDTPLNTTVPTLATMTKGALNVLDDDPQGLLLVIEGGAVDWAGHDNQIGRMLQEQIDFVQAVEAVVDWVDQTGKWDETLVILTADHETGMLWGPKSDTVPFDPIVNRGAGHVPEMKYNSGQHTNSLIPVYAKGAASRLLAKLVVGEDPVHGPYVDNTGIGRLLLNAVGDLPLKAPQHVRPQASRKPSPAVAK